MILCCLVSAIAPRGGGDKIRMEQWQNDGWQGNPERNSEINLIQCLFVCHESHMKSPGTEPDV